MATHPAPARQPWDRLGWGRTTAPGSWVSLWGQPQPKEQPGVLFSASSSPKPKGIQLFCGGCVTPQISQSTKIFIQASIPPLLAACPPHPSSTRVPPAPRRRSTREHRVLVGCEGAVRQQPAGQGPLPAPDLLRGRMFTLHPGM